MNGKNFDVCWCTTLNLCRRFKSSVLGLTEVGEAATPEKHEPVLLRGSCNLEEDSLVHL
jgi:hypothetical protein